MEPLRYLTYWLLSCCREVQDLSIPPKTLDAVSGRTSPFVVVLQYFSTLLRGRGSRLVLLFRAAGCSSFNDWLAGFSDDVMQFRMAISVASSWVFRRHLKDVETAPWSLMAVADGRLPLNQRLQVAESFCRLPPCCCRPGFARRLRTLNIAPQALLTSAWQKTFLEVARTVRFGVASIEWRHAWNRRYAGPSTAWHHFVASYCNREGMYLKRAREQRAALAQRSLSLANADVDAELPGPQEAPLAESFGFTHARSALGLFRIDWYTQRKALGQSQKWHASLWADIRRDFEALPEREQQRYRDESSLTVGIASRNRERAGSAHEQLDVRPFADNQPRPHRCLSLSMTPWIGQWAHLPPKGCHLTAI